MSSDANESQIIYPNIFTYPRMRTHFQKPRIFDTNVWLDDNSFANARTKGTKQGTFDRGHRKNGFEKEPFYYKPHPTLQG
jgi:hypothetical protein